MVIANCVADSTIWFVLESDFIQNMGWIKNSSVLDNDADSVKISSTVANPAYFIDGSFLSNIITPSLIEDEIGFINF